MILVLLAFAVYNLALEAVEIERVTGAISQNITPYPPAILERDRLINECALAAKKLIRSGDYSGAEGLLRPAIVRFGNDSFARSLYEEMAEVAIRQGKYVKAFELIPKKGAEYSDGRRYARIAFLKAALGDYQGSKAMWDEIGPIDYIQETFADDWPDVNSLGGLEASWLLVIGYLADVDDYVGAEYFFDLCKTYDHDSPILKFYLGNIAFVKKDYDKAAELLKAAEYAFHGDLAKRLCHDSWMRADFQRWLRHKNGDG